MGKILDFENLGSVSWTENITKLRIVMIVLWAFADLNLLDLLKIFTWFRGPTTLPQN